MPELRYHLTWYGHERCEDPACGREHDDPASDAPCPDPGRCDGSCRAHQLNAARRAHLTPPGAQTVLDRLAEEAK